MKKNVKHLTGFSLIELSVVMLIIGILVAGITQGSRIIKEARLKTAQTLTESSPVSSIKDLTLWLDATDAKTIGVSGEFGNAEDGDVVTAWNDKNPQLSSKINFTGTALYEANGINGLPSIDFNGTDSVLSNTSRAPISATDDSYTIIAVWMADTIPGVGGYGTIFHQGDADFDFVGSVAEDANLSLFSSVGNVYGFGKSTNAITADFDQAYTSDGEVISAVRVNGATNQLYHNANGDTPTQVLGVADGDILSDVVSIGAIDADTDVNFFGGKISEIIIFDRRIKKSELTDVVEYLSKKYGIELS